MKIYLIILAIKLLFYIKGIFFILDDNDNLKNSINLIQIKINVIFNNIYKYINKFKIIILNLFVYLNIYKLY